MSRISSQWTRICAVVPAVIAGALLFASAAQAEFGLQGFEVSFTNQDGSPATQAGSHPFVMTTTFHLNKRVDPVLGDVPDGEIKDLKVELPIGFVGNTTAVPRCTNADFLFDPRTEGSDCPNNTAVGVIHLEIINPGGLTAYAPVFNLVPPPGVAAKIGFLVEDAPVTIELGVKSGAPYNVSASLLNIPQVVPFYGSKLEVWGDPASPVHDSERGRCELYGGECPIDEREVPFLTLPTSCAGPLSVSFEADSWQDPETWVSGGAQTHDSSEPPNPIGTSGCDDLGFSPTIAAHPTNAAGESPTGLEFSLDVDNEGLVSPTGISQSDIKKVTVALPEAMSVNPALAEGLAACSEADLERETISAAPGEGCPNESKIGTVEVETPLLDQTLKGSLFLATPYLNPFGSLLALYVVVKNPETGILLKLPGKVEPNEVTGQLVSVFDDLPQLPFSHFRLSFRQGQRSPLVTPPDCGSYTTQAELTPWANPSSVLHDTAAFQITAGIAGAQCPSGGVQPFKPDVIAGTTNPAAGSYSPLDIRITRNDGEQEITGFSSQLPPGLTANLTGVPFCSEAQIAAGRAKGGAQEESEPSCPAASEIGHTLVGVGVGSVLAYTPGKLYMGGPYDGAPFSVVSITSAKVGPFDLGTVVVHLPLKIDPLTAQVSIPQGAADQIPHIIKGIIVHVRDIRVYVDREHFTINPTSCDRMSLSATVIGSGQNVASPADDDPVTASDPFQAADCQSLVFKPAFQVSTAAKVSRKDGASLNVSLTYPKEALGKDANIHEVKVALPKALPSRLSTLQKACTEAQFNTNPAGCPAASVVGHAKAITPILPVPLEGPAYFVSRGAEWPELIMVLQGYGLTIELHGETHISKGVTSSTFPMVPDQPVESFRLTLPAGPHSALAAPGGKLCQKKLMMPTSMTGQNGKPFQQKTRIQVQGCPDKLLLGAPKIKGRRLKLRVGVPAAGRLTAAGKGLGKVSKKASGRETLTLTLKRHGRRSRPARIRLSFTPSGGTSRKKLTRSITVKPASKHHKHRAGR